MTAMLDPIGGISPLELNEFERRILYGECSTLAQLLLPEEILRCRYWLVSVTQKLMSLLAGVDLCNISVLPTCAVLNIVRPLPGAQKGTAEGNSVRYGTRVLTGFGLEEHEDSEFHALKYGCTLGCFTS